MALNVEEFRIHDAIQDWTLSWHPAFLPVPSGTPWSSAGICLTADGEVVLVSSGGESWGLPGGRPEEDEDWRATLDREVREETCVRVDDATLLGFSRGVRTRGPEEGRVLVRTLWRAAVSVNPWEPHHETSHLLLAPLDEAMARVDLLRAAAAAISYFLSIEGED
jgi:ADP-ribose pyrophosphatase YjhB (NUDIX family)